MAIDDDPADSWTTVQKSKKGRRNAQHEAEQRLSESHGIEAKKKRLEGFLQHTSAAGRYLLDAEPSEMRIRHHCFAFLVRFGTESTRTYSRDTSSLDAVAIFVMMARIAPVWHFFTSAARSATKPLPFHKRQFSALMIRQAPTGTLDQHFDLPNISSTHLDGILRMVLVTEGCKFWMGDHYKQYPKQLSRRSFDFLAELPNVRHIEVHDPKYMLLPTSDMESTKQSLVTMLRAHKPDADLMFH